MLLQSLSQETARMLQTIILSLVSKILERTVHNRVTHHLTKKLPSNCQFGFRSGHSTQEALLTVTNELLATNHQIGSVLFDVRKAFNTVPHSISGPLLLWFRDYLSNRHQRVVLNRASSILHPGGPQGSILGPLLFNILINSITNISLSSGSKLALYTDDLVLYRLINSSLDVEALQEDINQWTKAHGLTLNFTKTNVLPITRSPQPIQLHHHLENTPLKVVSSVKYLGATISSDLAWNKHIFNLIKTTKRQIGLIHRKLYQATPKTRHAIY